MRVKEELSMKKKWICLLTVLTLIVGVCAAGPMISGAEEALDLTRENCSMMIYPESTKQNEKLKFGEDLNGADIVVDVYKVADAVKKPGYDTYSYGFKGVYSDLELPENAKDRNAAYWQQLAQDAGKRALGDVKGKETDIRQVKNSIEMTGQDGKKGKAANIENLTPGLYLLIVRSSYMGTPADYRVIMENPENKDDPMNGNIATIANSDTYTYIFSPQLISVPMRGQDGKALDVEGPVPGAENGPIPDMEEIYGTADGNSWIYNVNVYLKPIRIRRYGALAVEKSLLTYESEELVPGASDNLEGQDEKVTFIFRVEWTDPDTGAAESRVDSITFDSGAERTKRIVIERIPVGTEIKVTEIYEGASYELADGETGRTKTVTAENFRAERIQNGIAILDGGAVKTIIGDVVDAGKPQRQIPSVSFRNTYNRRQKKGYGINNKFEYQGDGNWLWTSDRDSTGKTVHNGTGTAGGGNENIPEPDVPPTEPQEPTVPDTPEPQGTTETP